MQIALALMVLGQVYPPPAAVGVCPNNDVVTGLTYGGPVCEPIVLDGGGIDLLGPVGSSPNANAASISGNTLNLQPASVTQPGVITSGTQTIGGDKTWPGDAGINGSLRVCGSPTPGYIGLEVSKGLRIENVCGGSGANIEVAPPGTFGLDPALIYTSGTGSGRATDMMFVGTTGSDLCWAGNNVPQNCISPAVGASNGIEWVVDTNGTTTQNGSAYVDGGIYVPDISNFGPGGFPIGDRGHGTYLGRDLYMENSSPQVSWFQAALTPGGSNTGTCDAGYNIYENTNAVLEINGVCPNGSGPETLCQFNFFPTAGIGSAPYFSCGGAVAGGDVSGDTVAIAGGILAYSNVGASSNNKYWWWQTTSSTTLDMRYVNDPQSGAGTAFRLTRNGSSPAGFTFYNSDGATTGLGMDGSGNVAMPNTLNVGVKIDAGQLLIPSQKASSGSRYLCIDINGGVFSSATACSGT